MKTALKSKKNENTAVKKDEQILCGYSTTENFHILDIFNNFRYLPSSLKNIIECPFMTVTTQS